MMHPIPTANRANSDQADQPPDKWKSLDAWLLLAGGCAAFAPLDHRINDRRSWLVAARVSFGPE